MSQNEHFTNIVAKFIKHKICPLADEKCYEAVDKFKEHKNTLRLVDDIFEYLISCDSDECKANEGVIKKTFEKFIKENEEKLP